MKILTDTISMKCWQAYVLMAMAGFAFGTVLSKTSAAFGY